MTTGTTTTTTAANDWARTFTATVQTAENSPRQHDHMMGSPALQPELHPRQNGTSNARLVPSLSAKSLGAGRSSFTGAIQALKGYVGRRGDAKLSKDTECRSVDVSRAGPNPANPLFPSFSVDIKRANSESDLSGRARRASMLRSSTRSLKGRKHPERENQDEFFSVPDLFQLHPNSAPPPPQATFGPVGIFGVCDGHGGGRCSAFVSKHLPVHLAASSAWARLSDPSTSACGGNGHACAASTDGDIRPCCRNSDRTGGEGEGALPLVPKVMREALVDGFRRTDGAFSKFAEAHKDNSGSTAVVAMVCNPWVVIANVGDSSALFYNDNAWVARNGAKSARTKAHDIHNPEEKRRVEDAGGTFTDGRLFDKLHPTRTFGNRDVRRMKEGVVIAEPEVTVHRIQPTTGSSFVVLGSDGLWCLDQDKVIKIVRAEDERQAAKKRPSTAKPSKTARLLAEKAVIRGGGTGDDVTAVVVLFS